MKVIVPKTIGDAMILAGTSVSEPAAGETAWVSGGTYALGDLRIRPSTHSVYECVLAHSGRTALPENDAQYWLRKGPTLRWAPFDTTISTGASSAGSMTYELQPGFFNAVALYGLGGTRVTVTVRDAPGGAVLLQQQTMLVQTEPGWYEYLFTDPKTIDRLSISGIPVRPTATLTVYIEGGTCSLGMLIAGDARSLVGDADWSGTQYGASAEPVTYSYINTDEYGVTTIKRRHHATNMRAQLLLPQSYADAALRILQDLLDVPAAWVATDLPGYAGLSAFGLGSASVSYAGPTHSEIDLTVKGMI